MSNLIYLASPYSKFPGGREEAFNTICKKAAQLMEQGHLIFCPIAHSHPIEDIGMTKIHDGDFWLKQDFAVLAACKELWVYKMPSWEDSYGVAKEIEFANKNNITVKFIDYDGRT